MPAVSRTLTLAIGVIDIMLGIAILAAGDPPAAGIRGGPGISTTTFGTFIVSVGVLSLILRAHWGALPRAWRVIGLILPILPLLAAGLSALRSGVVGGVSAFLILVIVHLVFAGVTERERFRAPRADAFILAVLLIEATLGALLLLVPHAFRSPLYRYVLPNREIIAASLFLGAGALAASVFARGVWSRAGVHLIAAAPLLALAAAFWRVSGSWPSISFYPVLAAFLIAQPWLERTRAERARFVQERPKAATFERTAEGVIWGVIFLLVVAANTEPSHSTRVALYGLAAGVSLFTLVWFRLPPGDNPRQRTLWGLAIYTAASGVVMHHTGGLNSPLFFLFFLAILAAAWGLAPRDVRVPAAIGLASIGAEAGLEVANSGFAMGSTTTLAVFKSMSLLFVSVFAYLLARRAVEQRVLLQQEKRELEVTLASLGEGVLVLDESGTIKTCNRAAEQMFNCRHEELVGRRLDAVLTLEGAHGADPGGFDPLGDALLRRRAARRERVLARFGSGDPVPIDLTVMPLEEPDGRSLGAVASLRDVRAEVEVARMREDFFHIASHEIRTPLAVIKGNAELALDGSLGPLSHPVQKVLTEIHGATGRLIRLVHDFLEAARLEHGKISLRLAPGSLPVLVRQAVATLERDAARKSLSLTYRLTDPSTVPPVLMDEEKALQVLLNLIGNSVKFTAAGGVDIWHVVADGVVETHVRDTGPGIPADQRHQLFERFSQVERGLTREGGSGLGLYISRKLAERMNGAVYLKESAPGGGSTFVFALPAKETRGGPAPAPEPVTRERTGTRTL